MKKCYTLIFLLNCLIFPQNWQKFDNLFLPSGIILKNFTSPSFCDLNGDGLMDVFIGANSADKIDFYFNTGSISNPHYTLDTNITNSIYSEGTQGTNASYPYAIDLDADGDSDLVIGGFNGLLYYKNIGTASNAIWLKDTTVFSTVNPLIGTDPKPAFADLDGDGDLDLFVGTGESYSGGPAAGSTISFRNIGTKTNPQFTLDSTLSLNIQNMHYNSFPTFIDLDNDGDFDCLFGRDLAAFVYYKNTGTSQTPVWTLASTPFNIVESNTFWKTPTFVDMDGDNDKDLVYGTYDGNLFVYENKGPVGNPSFSLNGKYFPVLKATGASSVSMVDFDKDGDLDLLSGTNTGKFFYFRNDGDNHNPVLTQISNAITNINPGSYSTPVFVDLDKDGDYDIVSGALSGQLYYYVNNNGSFTENTTMFAGIDVGWASFPAFGDINGDGYLDLLVGAEDADSVRLYLNDGANNFIRNDSLLKDITFHRNTAPAFVDLDNDGLLDLVFGSAFGDLYCYVNNGDKNFPAWTNADWLVTPLSPSQMSHPGFADIDADGKKDILIGEYSGNFTAYKNLFAGPSDIKNNQNHTPMHFALNQNYPNPFNPSTTIEYSVAQPSMVNIKVYDILGKEVSTLVNDFKSTGNYKVNFNASSLNSGVYFYKISTNNFTEIKKMVFIK